jgi:hypothetical protein
MVRTGFAGAAPWRRAREIRDLRHNHNVKPILSEFGPSGGARRHHFKHHGIDFLVDFHGFYATVMPKQFTIRHAYRFSPEMRPGSAAARGVSGASSPTSAFRQTVFTWFRVRSRSSLLRPPRRASRTRLLPWGGQGTRRVLKSKFTPCCSRAHMPATSVEIMGDGPSFPCCGALNGKLGRAGCVTLLGECDHVFVKCRPGEASILVQHSMTAPNDDREARGISLLEAVAAGIPVVTTDERGFSGAAQRGSTGRLSPEGTAQGMARNIVLLPASRQMRRDCSHRGRTRVEASFGTERTWETLRTHLFDRPMQEAQRAQTVDGVRA